MRDWNSVLLAANATEHSGTFGSPDQGGPCRTARAFAIVHIAIYDAVNSIKPRAEKYLTFRPTLHASIDAAVAQAAHDTLVALYPKQAAVFDAALDVYLAVLTDSPYKNRGRSLGAFCAARILEARIGDGSEVTTPYVPGQEPGEHREDPLNPGQGFLDPNWGSVTPFALLAGSQFRAPAPPALDSSEYTRAYLEVKNVGGDGITTPTLRDDEQTEIGLFWAYDGSKNLGTPPRLYNQILREIADQEGTDEVDNARLFALVNIAMADAGLCCWESKYFYDVWRPILGIREANIGTGPTGKGDNNPSTLGDADYIPLGAPASNASNGGNNFTPPFPAYPSGHATFGAALFRVLENFYGADDIEFAFLSDELNGITTDADGTTVRPVSPRAFDSLSQADAENAQSRIYLGIHWQFDATAGQSAGHNIADWTFDSVLTPLRPR